MALSTFLIVGALLGVAILMIPLILKGLILFGLAWSIGVLVGVVATELYYGRLRDELEDARARLRWKDK